MRLRRDVNRLGSIFRKGLDIPIFQGNASIGIGATKVYAIGACFIAVSSRIREQAR
jgi:hypothetical protein